jgi:hypothetical protein
MKPLALVAQAGFAGTIGYWAIVAIVLIVVVGIVYFVARRAGWSPPPDAVNMLWLVGIGIFGILLIVVMLRVAGAW